MIRKLTALGLVYIAVLIVSLQSHFMATPLDVQPTIGLFLVFAICAALGGLLSIWGAVGTSRWAARLPVFLLALALLLGGWILFVEWNQDVIWSMLVMVMALVTFLIVGLALFRVAGFTVDLEAKPVHQPEEMQVSLKDLMSLVASVAVLFAVLRFARPTDIPHDLFRVIVVGGVWGAVVSAVVVWTAFSSRTWLVRVAVFLAIAPSGGLIYTWARQQVWLLFNWQWYSGVTAVQMILMLIPLLMLRWSGYRIRRVRQTSGQLATAK